MFDDWCEIRESERGKKRLCGLLESADEGDRSLGCKIRDEVAHKTVRSGRITHGLFTLSGNATDTLLGADLAAADGMHSHIPFDASAPPV